MTRPNDPGNVQREPITSASLAADEHEPQIARIRAVLVVSSMAAGIAIFGSIVLQQIGMIPLVAMFAILGTIGLGSIAAIIVASLRMTAAVRAQILAVAESLGYEVVYRPEMRDRERVFSKIEPVVAGSSRGMGMIASPHAKGTDQPTACSLFMHRHTRGSGSNRSTTTTIGAIVDAPAQWPTLTLSPEHIGYKIGKWFGMNEFEAEHEEFNKRWFVATDDEPFAILALTPEVQDWLAEPPASPDRYRELWVIGSGVVACLAQHTSPTRLALLAERARTLRSLLPPELDAYEPEPNSPSQTAPET